MTTWHVEIQHSILTRVEVEAATAEEAARKVDQRDFPLPPRDEWEGQKDWRITVCDSNGDEIYEEAP